MIYTSPSYDPNFILTFRYLAFDSTKITNLLLFNSVINTTTFPASKTIATIGLSYVCINCFMTKTYCFEFGTSDFFIKNSLSSSFVLDFDTSVRSSGCGYQVVSVYFCIAIYSHSRVIIRFGELVADSSNSPTLNFNINDPTNLFFIGLTEWSQPLPSSAPYCISLHLNPDSVSVNTDISIFTQVKYKYYQIY